MKKIDFTKVEAFSVDGETYYEDDTCVIDHCLDNLDSGRHFTLYIGKKKELRHSDLFHPRQLESLVESLQERAYDYVGDMAEAYLEKFATPENETEFMNLICDWIQKKTGSVNFWSVEDVKEIRCLWSGEGYYQAETSKN